MAQEFFVKFSSIKFHKDPRKLSHVQGVWKTDIAETTDNSLSRVKCRQVLLILIASS
jgi:hypothetical protein